MPDLDYVIIVGRFGIPIEDGADPDEDPDMIWCDAGEISLEPLVAETKVVGGLPVPWTGGQSTFTPTIDAEGYSTWRGKHFIKAIDLTSTKVNPRIVDGKATHRVTFRNVKAGVLDVKFEMRNVRLSADMAEALDATAAAAYGLPTGALVCDLTKLLPVPVANSVPIVVGPQGPPGDPALTDEVTAGNIAEGDLTNVALSAKITAGAATITEGMLGVAGVPIAPEQVGAAVPTNVIFIPANDMRSVAGSVGANMDALNGVPLRLFPRRTRVIDSFNRADSASPGSTETGSAWTAANGGWSIASNRAVPGTSAGARITTPSDSTDGQTAITVVALPGTGDCSIVRRFTDAANYVFLNIRANGTLQLGHFIASAQTILASSTAAVAPGDTVRFKSIGGALTGYINGVAVVTGTTTVLSGTVVGLRNGADSTGTFRADDFITSDNDQAAATVQLPSGWTHFAVSALFINLAAGAGNVHWNYAEQPIDLVGSLAALNSIADFTLAAPPTVGPVQEVFLSATRPAPDSRIVTVAISRISASLDDTLASSAGLIGVVVREAA